VSGQFHFSPETYLDLIHREVPAYDRLQDEVARATLGLHPSSILDLGVGTGVTSQRVHAVHPTARLIGIDENAEMLHGARQALPGADLRVARLEDPLPDGPFDLAVSALAVHHLDGPGKTELFRRLAGVLVPDGRFVLADVVVPENPADVVTPIDWSFDMPSTVAEQLRWLTEAGFRARVAWAEADLAVLVGDRERLS
jgi:tRNA (cmo5U34)-methyltransferase